MELEKWETVTFVIGGLYCINNDHFYSFKTHKARYFLNDTEEESWEFGCVHTQRLPSFCPTHI